MRNKQVIPRNIQDMPHLRLPSFFVKVVDCTLVVAGTSAAAFAQDSIVLLPHRPVLIPGNSYMLVEAVAARSSCSTWFDF